MELVAEAAWPVKVRWLRRPTWALAQQEGWPGLPRWQPVPVRQEPAWTLWAAVAEAGVRSD